MNEYDLAYVKNNATNGLANIKFIATNTPSLAYIKSNDLNGNDLANVKNKATNGLANIKFIAINTPSLAYIKSNDLNGNGLAYVKNIWYFSFCCHRRPCVDAIRGVLFVSEVNGLRRRVEVQLRVGRMFKFY